MTDKITENEEIVTKQEESISQEIQKKEELLKQWHIMKIIPVYDNGKYVGTTTIIEKKDSTQEIKEKETVIHNKKIELQHKMITEWLTDEEKEILQML